MKPMEITQITSTLNQQMVAIYFKAVQATGGADLAALLGEVERRLKHNTYSIDCFRLFLPWAHKTGRIARVPDDLIEMWDEWRGTLPPAPTGKPQAVIPATASEKQPPPPKMDTEQMQARAIADYAAIVDAPHPVTIQPPAPEPPLVVVAAPVEPPAKAAEPAMAIVPPVPPVTPPTPMPTPEQLPLIATPAPSAPAPAPALRHIAPKFAVVSLADPDAPPLPPPAPKPPKPTIKRDGKFAFVKGLIAAKAHTRSQIIALAAARFPDWPIKLVECGVFSARSDMRKIDPATDWLPEPKPEAAK